jgi:hypothetical protein
MLYVVSMNYNATFGYSSHKGAHQYSVENSWFHSNLLIGILSDSSGSLICAEYTKDPQPKIQSVKIRR